MLAAKNLSPNQKAVKGFFVNLPDVYASYLSLSRACKKYPVTVADTSFTNKKICLYHYLRMSLISTSRYESTLVLT